MGSVYRATIRRDDWRMHEIIMQRLKKDKAQNITSCIFGRWDNLGLQKLDGEWCHVLGHWREYIEIAADMPKPKRHPRYYWSKHPRDAWNLREGGKAYTKQPIMRFRHG